MRNPLHRKRPKLRAPGSLITGIDLIFLGIVLVLLITPVIGCGKKASPIPPEGEQMPPPVSNLAALVDGDTLNLSWTVPAPTDQYPLPAAGFRVQAYKQSLDEPCLNCPPNYKPIGQLKVMGRLDKAAGQQSMRYQYPLEPGYHYTITVVAIGSDGSAGPKSNTLRIDH